MRFDALWEMWRMVIDHFGLAQCDKGDTLYWRWWIPENEAGSLAVMENE